MIVDGGGRACEVEDLIHFDEKRMGDVMAEQLEILVTKQMDSLVLEALLWQSCT